MKKHIQYTILGLLIGFVSAFQACEKEVTQLPPREVSPEVAEIVAEYVDVLLQRSEGWVLAYTPDQYEEPIYFHLVFKDEEKVDITSGYRGYHTLQSDVPYHFEGKYIPIIAFTGDNAFSELADLFNGSTKFKVYYSEDESTFEVERSDGFDNKRFELTRANDDNLALLHAQIQEVLDQIAYEEEQDRLSEEVRLKVKAFAEVESDFYFYNLMVDDFSATINSFDTIAREISLTYKETPTSAPTTRTVSYRLSPEGIILEPAIISGAVSIDVIQLGDLLYEDPEDRAAATAIEIVNAGNAGAGTMGYTHIPPYSYTLNEGRTVSTVDWLLDPDQQNAHLFMYTADADSYYSDFVNVDRQAFKDYINAEVDNAVATNRLVNQIYFPVSQSSSRNIQISTRNGAESGNRFFLYSFDLGKIEGEASALHITLTTPSASVVPYVDAFNDYLSPQFPAQGVTVVPVIVGTTLRFRLVSRQDSRYWVEYVLNRTADRSNRFD